MVLKEEDMCEELLAELKKRKIPPDTKERQPGSEYSKAYKAVKGRQAKRLKAVQALQATQQVVPRVMPQASFSHSRLCRSDRQWPPWPLPSRPEHC